MQMIVGTHHILELFRDSKFSPFDAESRSPTC